MSADEDAICIGPTYCDLFDCPACGMSTTNRARLPVSKPDENLLAAGELRDDLAMLAGLIRIHAWAAGLMGAGPMPHAEPLVLDRWTEVARVVLHWLRPADKRPTCPECAAPPTFLHKLSCSTGATLRMGGDPVTQTVRCGVLVERKPPAPHLAVSRGSVQSLHLQESALLGALVPEVIETFERKARSLRTMQQHAEALPQEAARFGAKASTYEYEARALRQRLDDVSGQEGDRGAQAERDLAALRKQVRDEAGRLDRLIDTISGPAAARRLRALLGELDAEGPA